MINDSQSIIKVVGVGTAGSIIVETMIRSNMHGVEFIAANTDPQVLICSTALTKILLTADLINGIDAGSFMDLMGESLQLKEIEASIAGSDLVFLIAGMGGRTGTIFTQLFATVARSLGIFTIGIVTLPFSCEGKYRMASAENGIKKLGKLVNSLFVMPNDQICASGVDKDCLEVFRTGDIIISGVLRGIIE